MANTIRVKRANVILDISPDAKDLYLGKGYSVVDEKGTVLEAAVANDVDALKRLVKELQETILQKDAEIAKLKAKATTKAEPKTEKPTKG